MNSSLTVSPKPSLWRSMVGRLRHFHRIRVVSPLRILAFILIVLACTGLIAPLSPSAAQTGQPIVYVVPIHGTIEPGIGHFLDRALDEAAEQGATAVILDINTPGGRLDTVLEMRDAILDSPVKTIAFVNREAFSAGALITIASNEIWVTPGGVFGAATPVLGSETADEKTISAVRSTFRSTAEHRGRDPLIAEAMVDPAVEVPGLDSSSTLLTLTSDQAIAWNYANGTANSVDDLIATLGLSGAEVRTMSPTFLETLVRWITQPAVASLLILAGLFLIVADALFAGFGVAAVAGLACFALFFWGHLIANLAGWEDLFLIVLGLLLIAVEIFVIPGFGVAGILGILALGGGLFLSMVGRGFQDFDIQEDAVRAGWTVVIAIVGALGALFAFGWIVSAATGGGTVRRRGLGGLMLPGTVDGPIAGVGRSRQPGWLVRKLGGGDALDPGGEPMPPPGRHETTNS
jgi:membrane-bound serine protease (ClpP class)